MHTSEPNMLGDRISVARQDLKLSQSELARRCGCTPAAIWAIEKGTRIPNSFTLRDICRSLNVSADWILEMEDDHQDRQCNGCGARMVYIRSKHPGNPRRLICPTCAVERLEDIHNLSSAGYGIAVRCSVTMSPDASPETIEALGKAATLAAKAMREGTL